MTGARGRLRRAQYDSARPASSIGRRARLVAHRGKHVGVAGLAQREAIDASGAVRPASAVDRPRPAVVHGVAASLTDRRARAFATIAPEAGLAVSVSVAAAVRAGRGPTRKSAACAVVAEARRRTDGTLLAVEATSATVGAGLADVALVAAAGGARLSVAGRGQAVAELALRGRVALVAEGAPHAAVGGLVTGLAGSALIAAARRTRRRVAE